MDQIELTTTEREALHSWRFPHPPPRVQRNMEALDLQRQGVASEAIWRLCAMAQPTFSRFSPCVSCRRHRGPQRGALSLSRRRAQWSAYRTP